MGRVVGNLPLVLDILIDNNEEDDSTVANLELVNIPIGDMRHGDFVPVALVSRFGRRLFRFYAVDSRKDEDDLRPRIRLSSFNFRRLGPSTEGWQLVFSTVEIVDVKKARAGDVTQSTSLRFNHRPHQFSARRRGWVMVNSNYVSAPIKYEATGSKGRQEPYEAVAPTKSERLTCRASLPLRIVLGLELRSHFDPFSDSNPRANGETLEIEIGAKRNLAEQEFSVDKLRVSAMTPWASGIARLACSNCHRSRALPPIFWQIIHFVKSIPGFLTTAIREVLHLAVGGPEFLCRTITGEPAIDGFGIVMTSEERLSMLGADPPRSSIDARTRRRRISVTAISLGHGRIRISESGVKASNPGKQTAAPVGPLAIPFILKLGLASRRQLELPMNSAVYIRRNARGVFANGFFRLVFPIAGVSVATMGLDSNNPGRILVYGYEVPISFIVAAAVLSLLVGVLSLRVSNGKAR